MVEATRSGFFRSRKTCLESIKEWQLLQGSRDRTDTIPNERHQIRVAVVIHNVSTVRNCELGCNRNANSKRKALKTQHFTRPRPTRVAGQFSSLANSNLTWVLFRRAVPFPLNGAVLKVIRRTKHPKQIMLTDNAFQVQMDAILTERSN